MPCKQCESWLLRAGRQGILCYRRRTEEPSKRMKLDLLLISTKLSPPLDEILAKQLLAEFISQEERYILGEWEPATLDRGQFADIASRIIYHLDSKNLNRKK